MPNSIDIKLNSGNNSMDSLVFYWIAEFEDDCIFQFENGTEHRFQEVKDHFDTLKYFTLQHKEKDLSFTVDLTLGIITCNTKYQAMKSEEKKNIRLIFFRRHKIEIGEKDLKEQTHNITYFLGYQYLDKNGHNIKVVLQIDEQGNWFLGD